MGVQYGRAIFVAWWGTILCRETQYYPILNNETVKKGMFFLRLLLILLFDMRHIVILNIFGHDNHVVKL